LIGLTGLQQPGHASLSARALLISSARLDICAPPVLWQAARENPMCSLRSVPRSVGLLHVKVQLN
jgi:hypothetical protein